MTTTSIDHDNDVITVTVETTAGECGLNPTTDPSCDPGERVRLRMITCYPEYGNRAQTQYAADGWGLTLRDALEDDDPRWIEIPELPQHAISDALRRVCPQALDVEVAAESALEAEHGLEGDAYIDAQNELRADVDAALAAAPAAAEDGASSSGGEARP